MNENKVHMLHSESITLFLCPGYVPLMSPRSLRVSSREKAALAGHWVGVWSPRVDEISQT